MVLDWPTAFVKRRPGRADQESQQRWLIGPPRVRKPSPARGFFQARAATGLPTSMAAVSSSPWLSLRGTRSRASVSGPPVGACRRIGRACIRGRKVAVGVGCGEWCERIESGRENTEERMPLMATCSSCVGVTLTGSRQAYFLRRRNAPQPAQPSPAAPINNVDGSGTATGLARRKPTSPAPSYDGAKGPLKEDDTLTAPMPQ